MPNHVLYSGLKHYPAGNTRLTVKNDMLDVTGMDHALDSVSIETAVAREWAVQLRPFPVQANTVFGATFHQVVSDQRKAVSQWVITQSPDGQYAYLMVNSKLEGEAFSICGYRDGQRVFKQKSLSIQAVAGWNIALIFELAGQPIIVTDAGYDTSSGIIDSITKRIGISGWVQVKDKGMPIGGSVEQDGETLIQVDGISIVPGKDRFQEGAISQVVISGQYIYPFSILGEYYTLN